MIARLIRWSIDNRLLVLLATLLLAAWGIVSLVRARACLAYAHAVIAQDSLHAVRVQ